jgi:hypothetical protein
MHRLTACRGDTGPEPVCLYAALLQVFLSTIKCLRIAQRQSKVRLRALSSADAKIRVLARMAIAADHPAQIAGPIVAIRSMGVRAPAGVRKGSDSHQLVLRRQMRPAMAALFGSRDEFPSALSQESVIRPGNQLGAILQLDSVGRFDDAPVRKHLRDRVSTIPTLSDRAIDPSPTLISAIGRVDPSAIRMGVSPDRQ